MGSRLTTVTSRHPQRVIGTIVVSYASSPVAEVYYAEEPPVEAPTASVTSEGACCRQIEFAGILRGTQVVEEAQQVVDFLLGDRISGRYPIEDVRLSRQ